MRFKTNENLEEENTVNLERLKTWLNYEQHQKDKYSTESEEILVTKG